MKKLVLFALLATGLTIFNGCQKDELIVRNEDFNHQVKKTPEVFEKNGILIFTDHNDVSEILRINQSMQEKERRMWENNHNFYSQLSLFNDVVIAEEQFYLPYENMSEEELSGITLAQKHSDMYSDYLVKGIIKEYVEEDGLTSYDYSTCAPYLVSILNENGIFMVADTMYQFTDNAIKVWEGANVMDVNSMVNNKSNDIQIHYVRKNLNLQKGAIYPNPKYSSWAYSGSQRRIKIGLYFDVWPSTTDRKIWSYQHYVHARSEKRALFSWNLNWTDMYILGRWDGQIEYKPIGSSSSAFHSFSSDFHDYPTAYHVYANNFYSSMSIESGTIYAHPATMSISYTEIYPSKNEIVDVDLTDFYWQVIGHNDAIAILND
jgi:hypothetical protein